MWGIEGTILSTFLQVGNHRSEDKESRLKDENFQGGAGDRRRPGVPAERRCMVLRLTQPPRDSAEGRIITIYSRSEGKRTN